MILAALLIAIQFWFNLPLFGITLAGACVTIGIMAEMVIDFLLVMSLLKYLRSAK